MKKIVIPFFTLLVFIVACSVQETNTDVSTLESRSIPLKNIEDYFYLGDIHNEYMENIDVNFNEFQDLNEAEGLQYTKDFHSSFLPSDTSHHSLIRTLFTEDVYDINIVNHNRLIENLDNFKLDEACDVLISESQIDLWEKQLFLGIITFAKQNPNLNELEGFINAKIDEWKEREYLENSNLGTYSAMILAIGKKSTEYWLDLNLKGNYLSNSRLLNFLAADLVGGTIGVAAHIAIKEFGNAGGHNENAAGGAFVVGAVMGSTGIAGRAGRAFSKWFKP